MTAVRTVLCFGDSNTHGTMAMATAQDRGRFDRATRWPGVVQARLGPDWHVIEEGHPGRTTVHPDPIEGVHKNGLAALPALLESHRPLDVVVVMLGTNDMKARFSVTPADIALSVEKLALAIGQSDAGPGGTAPAVMIVSPVAIRETGCLAGMFAGGQVKSRELAALLDSLARRLDLVFLDAAEVTAVDPLDGVHLKPDGHRAIGDRVAELLKNAIG